MLGSPKAQDLDRPVLIAVESYVPKDHFYPRLYRALISPSLAIYMRCPYRHLHA